MILGQNQETRVMGHQAQTLAALGLGPANPLFPMPQMFGRCAKDQQGQPLTAPDRYGIESARPPA